MINEKQLLVVNGEELKFPLEVNGRYVHLYDCDEKVQCFCIGSDEEECFTDHEECDYFGLEKEKYQEILKSFGAKQYHHEFDYGDYVLPVQDSYFTDLQSAIDCINHLVSL